MGYKALHVNKAKFALRNFSGTPVAYFTVERRALEGLPIPEVQPAHHVMVIDRSGSMWYDLDPLKTMIQKIMTVDEYRNSDLRFSIVSYSGHGDATVHLERIKADEILASDEYKKAIDAIRPTGLTCISGGLKLAEKLIDDRETTCISLHSDGWANDLSPAQEQRAIGTAIGMFAKRPNTYVNTVAYRDSSDFKTLDKIANSCSGTCVQAKTLKQVYDALNDTSKLLAGRMAPVYTVEKGSADYLVFASDAARKVFGGAEDLIVRGLGAEDDRTVYAFMTVTEERYHDTKLPLADEVMIDSLFGFARTHLAEGELNRAKFALVTSRVSSLIQEHYKALTNSGIAAFAGALESALFAPVGTAWAQNPNHGLPVTGASALKVLACLARHKDGVEINFNALKAGYKRRGIKRVSGVWVENADGTKTLQTPQYRDEVIEASEWLGIDAIEMNRATATANLRVAQPCRIVDRTSKQKVTRVAGINLDSFGLKMFRNYTLIGDGEVNVDSIRVRVSDKRCWIGLQNLGVIDDGTHGMTLNPDMEIEINLSDRPLVDFTGEFDLPPAESLKNLFTAAAVLKFLSAITRGGSVRYTGEQIEELAKYGLTPAGNVSFPSTNPYTDQKQAIAEGLIDSRVGYSITVGTPTLTSVSKLLSGNVFLDRRFVLKSGEDTVEKPNIQMLFGPLGHSLKVEVKELNKRVKLTGIDEVMFPVFCELLGVGTHAGEVANIMTIVGLEDAEVGATFKALRNRDSSDAGYEAISKARWKVEKWLDNVYSLVTGPVAFYVGASGLVPDSWGCKAETADHLLARRPEAALTKGEKEEGMFFELPNGLLLTVSTENLWYSTEHGAEVAAALDVNGVAGGVSV